MPTLEFSLPDELFQEVLVSKFSEEHVESTEKTEETINVPFSPLKTHQMMRIGNVSRIFFSTPEAKRFLKLSYNYIKDVLFSQQETKKRWEKFQKQYKEKLYNKREERNRRAERGYRKSLFSILHKIQMMRRIIDMVRRSFEIYNKIIHTNYDLPPRPKPKNIIDAFHQGIESVYKKTFINYLNISTDFLSVYFVDMMSAIRDGIVNSVIKRIIDSFIEKRIEKFRKKLIKKAGKYIIKKTGKKLLVKLLAAAGLMLASAVLTVATGGGGAASLVISATTSYALLRDDVQEIAQDINKFIDKNVSERLQSGIVALREMEDMTRGFKSPKEKITNIHDYVMDAEEEISMSRIFRKTTQSEEQRKVGLVNILLNNFIKMFKSDFSNLSALLFRYVETNIATDELLRNLWNFAKAEVYYSPKKFLANSDYVNFISSEYESFSESSSSNYLVRAQETDKRMKDFSQRVDLFIKNDAIEKNEEPFIIKDIYNQVQDFYVTRIIDDHTSNIIKRKTLIEKMREISNDLNTFGQQLSPQAS